MTLREIIADIDRQRADAERQRARMPSENRRYLLRLASTMAGAFVAGGAIVAAILRL